MCKQIVIDTSVAYDSGRNPNCTNFLNAVLNNGYHAVMSPFIWDEWTKCKTEFAFSWRAKMLDRRRFHVIPIKPNEKLRTEIVRFAPDGNCRDVMLKDVPLLETALEKDEIVISLDEKVRKLYAFISTSICEIRIIIWVNPTNEKENPLQWLENGAEAELCRQLGHLFDELKNKRVENEQENEQVSIAVGIFFQSLND